jgi:biopolymer transport protein ExbB
MLVRLARTAEGWRVRARHGELRANRVVLAKLDAFAHDLFAFLTTGSHFAEMQTGELPRAVPQVVTRGA